MNLQQPDWEALAFACKHESDKPLLSDQQAEDWYQESRAFYKQGIARDSNPELRQSVALALKAAERGHVKAMNNLVVAYRDGEGVQQSDDKAVEWAERMIKLESGRGYYHMGTFLEQGIGVKPSKEKALAYFRRAADLGNAQGQLAAGKAMMTAFAQSPHKQRGSDIAYAMMQCALDQGLDEAGYELGGWYKIRGRISEALRAYQSAGKLGHRQSLASLQALFEKGAPGLEPDPARAARYERLWEEVKEDKTKRFPTLDQICPLPPAKLQ